MKYILNLLQTIEIEDFSCCVDLLMAEAAAKETRKGRLRNACCKFWKSFSNFFSDKRKRIKEIADHKYFQQGTIT